MPIIVVERAADLPVGGQIELFLEWLDAPGIKPRSFLTSVRAGKAAYRIDLDSEADAVRFRAKLSMEDW